MKSLLLYAGVRSHHRGICSKCFDGSMSDNGPISQFSVSSSSNWGCNFFDVDYDQVDIDDLIVAIYLNGIINKNSLPGTTEG